MNTFEGVSVDETHMRAQNVYYTYRGGVGLIGPTTRPLPIAVENEQPQFYLRSLQPAAVSNNYAVVNYDHVMFSTGPNYAYTLNQVDESGSVTSGSDYRPPGSRAVNRFNPLYSDYRQSQQAVDYSESNRPSYEGNSNYSHLYTVL